ncbi:MAG: hypothetical protein WA667_04800 [Candidatus Nitrosopolaris sp.]
MERQKMNKLVMSGVSIPLLILIRPAQAFADPQHYYSYSECYNISYGHGYLDGQDVYGPVDACYKHTQVHCEYPLIGYLTR